MGAPVAVQTLTGQQIMGPPQIIPSQVIDPDIVQQVSPVLWINCFVW